MTDDGIAIHGSYSIVAEANATSLVIQSSGVIAGTTLRLYDDSFRPVGKLQISEVRKLPNDYRPPGGQNKSNSMPGHFTFSGPYSLLTVTPDSVVPAATDFDFLVANEGRLGNVFVLRNNTIRDHRARGMLIKASHGLIEDNVINGSTLGGIIITPELYWGEADFVTNLTVRRNKIARVGIGKQSYGALALGAKGPANSQGVETFVAGYGHRDVSITDNEFSDLDTTAIWVTSAQNVTIARNTIRRQWLEPTWATCCPPLPFPSSTVAWLSESSQVVVRENCVTQLGPFAETLYNYTDTVVDSDLDNGVRLCDSAQLEVAV
jgi:hypothetical protein